jgi:hypothetical protein
MAHARIRRASTVIAGAAATAAAFYGAYAGASWLQYGHVAEASEAEADEWLDRFMPVYEVVERHRIRIAAPASVTLAAAAEQDLSGPWLVRAIFNARALVLGGSSDKGLESQQLLTYVTSIGWRVLADVPGREIVVGAVTKPWEADVVFRGVPAAEFPGFAEPNYVKIVWSLRADPIDARTSVFRTETRAIATDRDSRAKFRRYWSLASPGIALIRQLSLRPLKAEAERRAHAAPMPAD